jgi:hypothetical protein
MAVGIGMVLLMAMVTQLLVLINKTYGLQG